jgi:hypothetical protein
MRNHRAYLVFDPATRQLSKPHEIPLRVEPQPKENFLTTSDQLARGASEKLRARWRPR